MYSEPATGHWVICPSCHKADISGSRYCQRCWGAVLHPEVSLTPEQEEEVKRRRLGYLKRRKVIRLGTIAISSVAALLSVYFGLYFFTDTVYVPNPALNSASLPGDWAMFGYNLGHSGSPQSDGVVPGGELKWKFSTGAPINSTPAFADGRVFFGSQDHNLYAINADTGSQEWQFQTGSWVESSPAVVDGTVYFGSNDSRLYAVDSAGGNKLWEFKTAFPVESDPSIAGDIVYFGSDDYYMYALNKDSGKKIWNFDTGSPAKSSPVIANGILYTGSGGNGFSYAVNAENGSRRLRYKSHYTVYTAPAFQDKIVYFVTTNGMVNAVDGKARTWLREHEIRPFWTQMYVMGIPAIAEPPAQSGLLWTFKLPGASSSPPVVAGDTLYVGSDWSLVALDINTQEIRWEYETSGTIRSSAAVVGNTVIFGSEDGRLYALDAATGEKRWDYPTGGKITASPIVVNGVVYIGSHDGILYAIE